MTEEEMFAHVARVEAEKDWLRCDQRIKGKQLSFDEAVFEASRSRLNSILMNVAGFPNIPVGDEILEQWKSFCISQIRMIVDPALCKLFSELDPCWGHDHNAGRRHNVLSKDHDLLKPRAKKLVRKIDGNLEGRIFKQRYTAVLIRTAEQMNTTNWPLLARGFYASYSRTGPS